MSNTIPMDTHPLVPAHLSYICELNKKCLHNQNCFTPALFSRGKINILLRKIGVCAKLYLLFLIRQWGWIQGWHLWDRKKEWRKHFDYDKKTYSALLSIHSLRESNIQRPRHRFMNKTWSWFGSQYNSNPFILLISPDNGESFWFEDRQLQSDRAILLVPNPVKNHNFFSITDSCLNWGLIILSHCLPENKLRLISWLMQWVSWTTFYVMCLNYKLCLLIFLVVLGFEPWVTPPPLPFFWERFFEIGSRELFAWVGFKPWSSWSLPLE
jgi:hypothetical protein